MPQELPEQLVPRTLTSAALRQPASAAFQTPASPQPSVAVPMEVASQMSAQQRAMFMRDFASVAALQGEAPESPNATAGCVGCNQDSAARGEQQGFGEPSVPTMPTQVSRVSEGFFLGEGRLQVLGGPASPAVHGMNGVSLGLNAYGESTYNTRSGSSDELVYADARDEIFRDTRCGKKIREYWWVQNLTIAPGVFWIIVFRVVIYQRCVEIFVGGGRWVGGRVVPDPALPTVPLWDVPWVEIKTAGGHFVRMGVVIFHRGDTVIAGPGNGVGPATERSGGFIVIESDCPNWTYHRFKRGSVVVKWCDPNKADTKIPPNPGDDQVWVLDEPPGGLPTEPAGGGGAKIGVDIPGEWPNDVKSIGEQNGYKSYTVTREYLSIVCCQNKIIAIFYLPMSRTYNFTCNPGNQWSTYTGWTPSGGDPTPIDPANPPPPGSNEAGLLGEALRLARRFGDC